MLLVSMLVVVVSGIAVLLMSVLIILWWCHPHLGRRPFGLAVTAVAWWINLTSLLSNLNTVLDALNAPPRIW